MAQPMSVKNCISALEQIPEWRPKSVRELSRRIRWEKGWQGVGMLSYRALQQTVGGSTMRQTFRIIDANNPPTSLRQAYQRLGFPIGGGLTRITEPISLRQITRRTVAPNVVSLRFLSYNTYLLPGLQIPFGQWIDDTVGWDALSWFGINLGGALLAKLGLISLPGLALTTILKNAGYSPSKIIQKITGKDLNTVVSIGGKPALEARASEMGSVLSDYDVCCLCEVFTDDARNRISNGLTQGNWSKVMGPDRSGAWTLAGSGLYFLLKNWRINRVEEKEFSNQGDRGKDSDAWSKKGILFNAIDFGLGELEIFQTHLYYGGGIPLMPEPSSEERINVQRAQLAELRDFYRKHHRPENVAIVTGDFNLSGSNIRQYAEIRRCIDSMNLQDVWAWDVYKHQPSGGLTCRFTDGDISAWQRDFREQCDQLTQPNCQGRRCQYCVDRLPIPRSRDGVGRYDFVFIERPTPVHRYNLEISRVLRRPFPRQASTDGESFLSDHLGLELMLMVSPR